jgi:hypothetical protein
MAIGITVLSNPASNLKDISRAHALTWSFGTVVFLVGNPVVETWSVNLVEMLTQV